MNRRALILSVLAVSAAGFGSAAWYATRPASTAEVSTVDSTFAQALIRPHSPILGPKDAPVTIVEFFDPACEACRAFHPIVKDIMKEHADTVRVVIRYTPLHGETSEVAVRILEAARAQGKFEEVLNFILWSQPQWASHGKMNSDVLYRMAISAGLDQETARTQMQAPQTTRVLQQDLADVKTVGVRKTPTFFVNGKPLERFGEAELRALVATEVAAVKG
jgi:protein-disulfide isomerase